MTWVDRVLVLVLASLLSLQLLASGRHTDDQAGHNEHCASCFFAHQVPHGLPDAEPVLVPVAMAQVYRIERAVIYQAPSYPRFLIPHSQAPPTA